MLKFLILVRILSEHHRSSPWFIMTWIVEIPWRNFRWRSYFRLPRQALGVWPPPGADYVTPHVTKTLKKVINKWLGAVTKLNQKTNFKNKVSDSNYREINPNFFLEWNSKFWSFFGKNLFFLAIRCNKDHASQISSKSKVLKKFGEFLSKFNS
jgi:hypothetical protein